MLHQAAPYLMDVEPFRFDYVDIVRQGMADLFEDVYRYPVPSTYNAPTNLAS